MKCIQAECLLHVINGITIEIRKVITKYEIDINIQTHTHTHTPTQTLYHLLVNS